MVSRNNERALELAARYPASREILEFYVELDAARRQQLRAALDELSSPASAKCPACGHSAQCAALRREGDGNALFLVCSCCAAEWPFPRTQCPACLLDGEKHLSFYTAEQFPHLQTLLCQSCHRYLHVINCAMEIAAIPEVDELSATPLDVWAREQGYQKITPNLGGI